jgi:hypothetical protein
MEGKDRGWWGKKEFYEMYFLSKQINRVLLKNSNIAA